MTVDAQALVNAGRRLHEAARTHKRSANAHRRQAQEAMRALDEVKAACARLGVELTIEDTDRGGPSQHAPAP